MKQLTVSPILSVPIGIELIINLNYQPEFYPANIKLEKFEKRKDLIQKDNVAGIGHLQSLLESPTEIPRDFYQHINLASGSVFKKNESLFIPALVHDGFLDAVALSNRDIDWTIILVEIKSPLSERERVIVLG
jgi:hypothetical protein